jgi:hypothetical protein
VAELHIKSLTCINKQTTGTAKDRASLQVNGHTFSGPHILGKGNSVTLNLRHPFTNQVAVQLVEEDNKSGDEVLGTEVVHDTLAGQREKTAHFNDAPHAHYEMTYRVLA